VATRATHLKSEGCKQKNEAAHSERYNKFRCGSHAREYRQLPASSLQSDPSQTYTLTFYLPGDVRLMMNTSLRQLVPAIEHSDVPFSFPEVPSPFRGEQKEPACR